MKNFTFARRTLAAACLILISRPLSAESLRPNDNIAICGDSITEQRLYSVMMEEYLLLCQPVVNVQAHQIGWGGETASGFIKRIESDVLPFHPTVATTLYGMNDGGYVATTPATLNLYRTQMETAVQKLKAGGVRYVLIGSPGVVDTEKFKTTPWAKSTPEVYNKTLADLSAVARQVAEKTGVSFVDVNAAMRSAMEKAKAKYGPTYPFVRDGVHPSFNGHLVMAYAFLKGLGCDGDIGTITLDEKDGKATATAGHKILGATGSKIEVESSRYPFCFVDDPASPESTRAVLECVPFNEELNRFRLVVKNLKAPRAKVTWGSATKEFSAEQLSAGINLAAEFLDNPFSESFAKAEAAIKKQQDFETPATKVLLHSLPTWQANLPKDEPVLARLQQDLLDEDAELTDAARHSFGPVRHTLQITPTS